jgi:hypothetical protein
MAAVLPAPSAAKTPPPVRISTPSVPPPPQGITSQRTLAGAALSPQRGGAARPTPPPSNAQRAISGIELDGSDAEGPELPNAATLPSSPPPAVAAVQSGPYPTAVGYIGPGGAQQAQPQGFAPQPTWGDGPPPADLPSAEDYLAMANDAHGLGPTGGHVPIRPTPPAMPSARPMPIPPMQTMPATPIQAIQPIHPVEDVPFSATMITSIPTPPPDGEDFHSTTPIGSKPLLPDSGGLGWNTTIAAPIVLQPTGRAGATRLASQPSIPAQKPPTSRRWLLVLFALLLIGGGGGFAVYWFVW